MFVYCQKEAVDCLQGHQFSLAVHNLQRLEGPFSIKCDDVKFLSWTNINTVYSIIIVCKRASFECGRSLWFLMETVCMGWPWLCYWHEICRGPFGPMTVCGSDFSSRKREQPLFYLLLTCSSWRGFKGYLIPFCSLIFHWLFSELSKVKQLLQVKESWALSELLVHQKAW